MSAVNLGLPRPPARPDTTDRPDDRRLIDRFGRAARDLRVSVTERCSLRCTYCMPEEGLPVIARERLLTPAEIARLVGIAVRDLGVREVRFTGGEPLMRADLAAIVAATRAVAPTLPIALTTNGIGLDKRLPALLAAGLTRVNISLDTVDREHFAHLTRRDRLPAVLAGIEAARAAGLTPVKVNAVLMRETLPDAPDLLAWAVQAGVRSAPADRQLAADHLDRGVAREERAQQHPAGARLPEQQEGARRHLRRVRPDAPGLLPAPEQNLTTRVTSPTDPGGDHDRGAG